jgi:hypothetical protein
MFNTLPAILDFVATTKTDYVAQKYIENPLLVKGTEFPCWFVLSLSVC